MEGSLSLDGQGKIIRCSRALAGMLGYSPADVLGRDFAFLAPEGYEGEFSALLRNGCADASGEAKKTSFLCADDSVRDFHLSVHPLADPGGAPYSYIVNISETPALKPAILGEGFRRIFRFSSDAVAITDLDGSIIDVNQAFLDTYEYERAELLGKNPRVLKSQHSSRALYEKMWEDILDPGKGYWRGEIINMSKSGREVPVILSLNAVTGPDGEMTNFLGIAFDMTRERDVERIRKMYIDHLVHDIRGPLTSICVNAELLLMELESAAPKTRRKLEVILASAQRIDAMASDMLEFSRAQNGALRLKKEKVEVSRVLREAYEPFKASGKSFLVNGAPYHEGSVDGEVMADAEKLQRALYNVFSNAFKHASTIVAFDTERVEEGLRFMVTDDGNGIPKRDNARVFDAFYQAEEGVMAGGAGLGLNIVKCFVEAHGGKVWLEPGSGSGVKVGFLIPA